MSYAKCFQCQLHAPIPPPQSIAPQLTKLSTRCQKIVHATRPRVSQCRRERAQERAVVDDVEAFDAEIKTEKITRDNLCSRGFAEVLACLGSACWRQLYANDKPTR
jgi:hypothetical protein